MTRIEPKNLSAQIAYKAHGNPPSTLPASAISNCFPGLELDFRAVWKHLFSDIELHECGLVTDGHIVLDVEPESEPWQRGLRPLDRLVSVDGGPVVATGQMAGTALEFSNALADIFDKAGSKVTCRFHSRDTGEEIEVELFVNPVLENGVISSDIAEPGQLTQGLCSPWQADYRECGCYYWAASRPDFVNAEPQGPDGVSGHSWMQRDRGDRGNRPDGRPYPNRPLPDTSADPPDQEPVHFTYQELYLHWQEKLQFVIGGRDESHQ